MANTPPSSQTDLERGIVSSAPAAERATDAARLLALVLLRDDPRVQAAYQTWHARKLREGAHIPASEVPRFLPEIVQSLQEDARVLFALVRDLGLASYRWLPKVLLQEFQRVAIGFEGPLMVTFPDDLQWATAGKRPKTQIRQPKDAMGSNRLENLEQQVKWFYRCTVKVPPDKKHVLARELGVGRSDVQHACKKVRALLACIDAPLPL